MKLLRPLAGYTIYDHKTNDSVRRELQTESTLDKIDEYRRNWLLHPQRMLMWLGSVTLFLRHPVRVSNLISFLSFYPLYREKQLKATVAIFLCF
jgi:hypothetical protein